MLRNECKAIKLGLIKYVVKFKMNNFFNFYRVIAEIMEKRTIMSVFLLKPKHEFTKYCFIFFVVCYESNENNYVYRLEL